MDKEAIRAILKAKEAYSKGENITAVLKNYYNSEKNNDEIIEIAYDLQTGSYVDFYKKNIEQ